MTHLHRGLAVGTFLVCAIACGKKGPPLPPLHPVPDRPAGVTLVRTGDRVEMRFTLPTANTDKSEPAALDRVDVYAMTIAANLPPPVTLQIVNSKRLIGSVRAKPTTPPNAPAAPASTLPPDTRPGQGEATTFAETLTSASETPELQAIPAGTKNAAPPVAGAPSVATRYYLLVSAATGHHLGGQSGLLALTFAPAPPVPTDVVVAYDETTLTVTWAGSPGAAFRVYAVNRAGERQGSGLLTPTAIETARYTQPVAFGPEVCFAVSAATVTGAVSIESEPSQPSCKTPVDTFPPAAPTGLVAVPQATAAGANSVRLSWIAVDAADLAGYIVRRAVTPQDPQQPLVLQDVSPRPFITATQFVDPTVRAGVRYTYKVYAVDKTGNESPAVTAAPVNCCGLPPSMARWTP